MPARTNTFSGWFTHDNSRPSLDRLQPLPYIADAFHQYVYNDIPVRLIDTDTLKFVERGTIHDIFFSDVARITENDIGERMRTMKLDLHPEAGIYIKLHKMAVRETIRDVVRYAIFSHRWTDSEPAYKDVLIPGRLGSGNRRSVRTAGIAKLVQLCETARTLGYKFVWSDTCCIDKTNTAELSEAINAMFRWYAHAHVCIVHLGASSSLRDFGHEPWFTRGWTLQELLAPRRIKFFNKEWRPLTNLVNDKGDSALTRMLSSVTGIPHDVVVADNSRGIKGRSVWEMMSWASKRKTTRVEDNAYCLFGLFDVHPHIAYGEGEKAFPRLIKAIMASYPTWDTFVWAGQASEQHPVLPSSPACYPKWDKAMTSGDVGMTEFRLTPHGLRLTSVPLIPVGFSSEAKAHDGSYVVTLRPQLMSTGTTEQLGVYSGIHIICGSGRLQHLRVATDLQVCILNYKPNQSNHHQGEVQVGRTYVCFLLHMKKRNAEGETTWLKFATDNVLRITCRREASMTPGNRVFHLPLQTTYIRTPRAQSTLWG